MSTNVGSRAMTEDEHMYVRYVHTYVRDKPYIFPCHFVVRGNPIATSLHEGIIKTAS